MKVLLCNWHESDRVRIPRNEMLFDELNNLLKEMGHDSNIVTLESVINTLGKPVPTDRYRYSLVDMATLFKEYLEKYESMFSLDLIISTDCCVALADIKAPIITIISNPFDKLIELYKEKRFYGVNEELELEAYSIMQSLQLKKSKKIITTCKFMQKCIEEKGFNSTLIDGFVDTRKYDVISKEKVEEIKNLHGLPRDKKIGLWSGVFRPESGFEFVSKLARDFQNVHWLLIFKEDITYKPLLKNVTLLTSGLLPAEYFNIADFYVNTDYINEFGIETLESAACNKPVVTSKTGWFFDAESGDIGEVVKSQDYESYKEAVEKVLIGEYKPREVIIQSKLDIASWKERIRNIINMENK